VLRINVHSSSYAKVYILPTEQKELHLRIYTNVTNAMTYIEQNKTFASYFSKL